ncbi:MAG TPA: hypothetical protein VLV83_14165 [Acidobacteriota bacterium]|nr:hypothetical protein [Acidobacteriota bacterium]
MSNQHVSVRDWILVPALITLLVSLLRLTGELLDWGPLFSRDPGGGGSPFGISWLIPIFGFYFGWALSKRGYRPHSSGRAWGAWAVCFLLLLASGAVTAWLGITYPAFAAVIIMMAIVAYLVVAHWGPLGKVLFAYAWAARIPVIIIALFAIAGDWGTHYEKGPPDFVYPQSTFEHWLQLGLLPQASIWITITLTFGGLFALIGTHIGARGQRRS